MAGGLLVSSLVLIFAVFIEIHAQLSISTSTPTPCYGDVVTLVCHHPEVASNPKKYYDTAPLWRENNENIRATDGSIYAEDLVSSTQTFLTINITVDHFRNKSFEYSCELALANENGRPTGEVETSGVVTVDPVEPQPSSIINQISCLETSIAISWTHTPMECYKNRISYYVYWVNVDNTTENGSYVTREHMYNITGLVANGNYTVSVWVVVDGNVQSTAVSISVTTELPKKPHSIGFTSDMDSITVSWEHDNECSCLKGRHVFEFIVTWWKTNANVDSKMIDVSTFDIKTVDSDANYTICVSVVCPFDDKVESERSCIYNATTVMGHSQPPPTGNLLYLLLIIVVLALFGGIVVVATGVCLWRKRKSRRIDCVEYESLWLLQVTDSLNRNGVKIISIRGNCVSAKCDPCRCKGKATTVDIHGTFNEKSFVLDIVQHGKVSLEGFIAELLRRKNSLSAQYCYALWARGSVPRKVQSQFKKVPEWRNENSAVLPVQGFPWKVGSKEEKKFVQLFKACFPSHSFEIEAMDQVSLGLSSEEGDITSPVEESDQVTVTIPHSDPPQVDVAKLVELLLISKPPTTEETDGDVKVPLENPDASVTAASLNEYQPGGVHSTDALVSKQDTSVISGGRRRSYTRTSFIDGVVSVLEILHVTILSIGKRCRRPECQDANTCTHLSTFQPDVVGVFGDASFIIKCVLHRHDGDVTGDHVTTLNNVRTGLGLPLGLLVYDHMEGDPQLLSQQMPIGCSLVHVGAFTWDSDWVKSTLVALCKAFKPPVVVDTCPPAQQVQYADILVDKDRPVRNPSLEKTNYSEISAIGEKAAELVEDKPPPVPPKETHPMEEQFQTAIIEALTEIGMTLHLQELDFFTATYQSMEFLGVSRVESEEDVTPADVEKVVRAKTKMAASRAVFICNQDTIPSDRLIDLQKASCYFIKAGGYGAEKWKNCLISNFKETVGDWMEEQNPGPHHSVEGVFLEGDKGVLHPEEEEESGLSPPVEEAGVTGRYGAVKVNDKERIFRKPPTTGLSQFDPKVTACLGGSPQSSTPQHIYVAGQYDEVPVQETTERIPPMTLVTRLESDDLSEGKSPLSNSEFTDTFEKEKNKI